MNEIIILNQPPVIFTKDEAWQSTVAQRIELKPGAIILLPDDAILYEPPTQSSPLLDGEKTR